jgi:hypothetical protein
MIDANRYSTAEIFRRGRDAGLLFVPGRSDSCKGDLSMALAALHLCVAQSYLHGLFAAAVRKVPQSHPINPAVSQLSHL